MTTLNDSRTTQQGDEVGSYDDKVGVVLVDPAGELYDEDNPFHVAARLAQDTTQFDELVALWTEAVDLLEQIRDARGGTMPAPEPWHVVGSTDEPAFLGDWTAITNARFYRDAAERVWVEMIVTGTAGTDIFVLPDGYFPDGQVVDAVVRSFTSDFSTEGKAVVSVSTMDGTVTCNSADHEVIVAAINFRHA